MKRIVAGLLIMMGLTMGQVEAINRIGIRQTSNGGEFYDTVTNEKFVFRGNNYYFTGDVYNATELKNTLDQFKHDGYNSLRIFIRYDAVGDQSGGEGLSTKYMDGIAELLKEAEKRKLYVLVAFEILPSTGGYYPSGVTIPTWDATTLTINDPNINKYYMNQTLIEAKKKYVKDFINALKQRNVPMEVVWGYEIQNEMKYVTDQAPLNQTGTVKTADGLTYNMGDETQKKQAMSANLVYWSNQITMAIKEADPQALAVFSPFPPTAIPKLQVPWAMETYWIFADPDKGGSSIDFIDLHPYQWIGTLAQQMADYHISSHKKPIVMGEFGADKGTYKTLGEAVAVMRDWQVASCEYNFGGWFSWMWDAMAKETGFYSVVESNGAINTIMAPINRADACKSGNMPLTVGYLAPLNCDSWTGWTAKTMATTTQLQVDFYADGNKYLGAATANLTREPAVCEAIGSTELPCKHGFVFNIPDSLKDGKSHVIDVYAINGANNPKLEGSGNTITCAALTPTMVPTNTPTAVPTTGVKVGDANGDGKTDLLDFSIWKQEYSGNVTTKKADFNKDNKVDLLDFSMWKREYSKN